MKDSTSRFLFYFLIIFLMLNGLDLIIESNIVILIKAVLAVVGTVLVIRKMKKDKIIH